MKIKKTPPDKLPFHLQDALDKIKLPKQKKSKRGPVILGILLIHGLLIFALQEDMMRRAKAMFKPEIVYATIIPPALPPTPAPANSPHSPNSPANKGKEGNKPAASALTAKPSSSASAAATSSSQTAAAAAVVAASANRP